MKKEITWVRKNSSIVSVIKEMYRKGELVNAWLFMHRDVYEKFIKEKGKEIVFNGMPFCMGGNEWLFLSGMTIATEKVIMREQTFYSYDNVEMAEDPQNIIFLKFAR